MDKGIGKDGHFCNKNELTYIMHSQFCNINEPEYDEFDN